MLIEYIKRMKDFTNPETGRYDGSYGPALYECLPFIIQQLRADPYTRRAVLPMLRMQHVASPTSKDFPCNIVLGFRIRDKQLNMNIVTRSQDLYRGFLYDTLEFQLLQLMLSKVLKLNVGKYHHTIFSLHLYNDDIEKTRASAIMPEAGASDAPNLPNFETFQDLWEFCHIRCHIADYAVWNPENPFYMLADYNLGNDDISLAIARWVARKPLTTPVGPYTKWVQKWLEK
jgi:hypothetical protein